MIDTWHQAASFDWETLAPVIFFIAYGLTQLFGSKKKKNQPAEDEEPDVDPMERARQIREEIRRKIEERRQANEPGTTRPVNRPGYDPTVPDGHQHRSSPRPEPVARSQPRMAPVAPSAPGENRAARMQQLLAEQRQRLEKARRQQAEAHERPQRMIRDAGGESRRGTVAKEASGGRFQQQLLRGIRDRDGLRKAVLYREILGPPVGLR